MQLYLPTAPGEWAAWGTAVVTVFFGLLLLFAPRFSFRLLRLQTVPEHPEAVAAGRATMAGFHLGVGICALLLAQPLVYMALGTGWGFAAFGRIVSMMSDRGNTPFNWVSLVAEASLAAAPLLYVFGMI